METRKIDGREIAGQIKEEWKKKIQDLGEIYGRGPALAVVLVGEDPASQIYVRNKKKACETVGMISKIFTFPATASQEEVLTLIERLNKDPEIDGILLQLPLPPYMDAQRMTRAIAPEKDVDGFHPLNAGRLLTGEEGFIPCTPAGILELLRRSKVTIDGQHCVIVGRSHIVGKPMAVLMLRENATVTIAHSHTKNLEDLCKQADILIVAMGKPKKITADYIKKGATVIDVGMHRMADGKLCGDVDFASVDGIASAIPPVPGGVGPMTIAMLVNNCGISWMRKRA